MTASGGPRRERDLVARLERQQETLLGISRLWRHSEGDLDAAMGVITEAGARALDIARVSVWFYDRERRSIRCGDLYESASRRHSRGMELRATDYPAYLEAIESEEVVDAHDAHTDARTREFSEG